MPGHIPSPTIVSGAPPAGPWRMEMVFGATDGVLTGGELPYRIRGLGNDLWPVDTVVSTPEGHSARVGWYLIQDPNEQGYVADRNLPSAIPLRGAAICRNSGIARLIVARQAPDSFASRTIETNFALGDPLIVRGCRMRIYTFTENFTFIANVLDHEYISTPAARWRAADQVEYTEAGFLSTGINARFQFQMPANATRIEFRIGGVGAASSLTTNNAYLYIEDVTP